LLRNATALNDSWGAPARAGSQSAAALVAFGSSAGCAAV